ncbi:hypothetical protein HPB51_019944 [Rhipicephalus microplus]|uniref:Uncharacterized protein n=1 Tax=Rhipicephalus microplus TaxID=6941 RepID=A0A9J6E309_RHIMP|nr:hypothetical protein HPB51_019944 [Rhipicephalus microplus]
MFVYVEYKPSLKTGVVEHTRIHCSPMEPFNPKDVNDFSCSRTYYVRSCHKDRLYEAIKVIHITETLEEMAAFRAARSRRQVEAGRNDCEMSTTAACRDQEHIEEQERQEQIHAALVQYGMGPLPVHVEKVTQEHTIVESELEDIGNMDHCETKHECIKYPRVESGIKTPG